MSKGEETRKYILSESADLFSLQGYAGTSMSDVLRATGMEKGGIYNHFKSKEQLALEAYDYATAKLNQRMIDMIYAHKHAADRLLAMIDALKLSLESPIVSGGCPIMNAAVESDDTHPRMRARVAKTFKLWMYTIQRTCEKGIARGEIKPETDIDELASMLIASLEGALMMSKACNDPEHMTRTINFLKAHINRDVRA